jgi:hypothetical protein
MVVAYFHTTGKRISTQEQNAESCKTLRAPHLPAFLSFTNCFLPKKLETVNNEMQKNAKIL